MFNEKLLIHLDFSKNLFVKYPIVIPVINPVIKIGSPIYFAPEPKSNVAKNIWTRLLVSAPITLIPIIEIHLLNKKYTNNIIIPLESDPDSEYKNTQLNIVPVTKDVPIDLIKINNIVPVGFNNTKDNKIGILANPILKKGIGFGIIYSIIDKKRDSAPKIDIILSLSVCDNVNFTIVIPFY